MASVSPGSDIRQQSLAWNGFAAKFAGKQLEPWAPLFWAKAQEYGIDANWVAAYLQWENNFGSHGGRHFSMDHNNPWDQLCFAGAPACHDPGNGYSYAVYPTMEEGIEAGFRNWRWYLDSGWTTWQSSLCVALRGQADCDAQWVANVIATAQANAAQWPYDGQPGPWPGPPGPGPRPGPFRVPIWAIGMAMLGAVVVLGMSEGERG